MLSNINLFFFTAAWQDISFDVSIYGPAEAECQNDSQQLDETYSNSYSNRNVDVLHDQLNECVVAALENTEMIYKSSLYFILKGNDYSLLSTLQEVDCLLGCSACVVCYKFTNVPEVLAASVIKAMEANPENSRLCTHRSENLNPTKKN